MYYPKTYIAIFIFILSSHVYLFSQVKLEHKKRVISNKPKTIPLKLNNVKIKIKQKEVKKTKEVKKIEKPKANKKVIEKKEPIKKNKLKKIKPKKKIIKKKIKKIVKKKVVKKPLKKAKHKKKIVPTITKKPPVVKKTPELAVSEKKAIEDKYLLELKKIIEENKFYPKRAKRLNQTGTVVIGFTILQNGDFSNITIKKKSKFKRLNMAAIKILTKLKSFKKIPKELKKQKWDIVIPIEYKIIR